MKTLTFIKYGIALFLKSKIALQSLLTVKGLVMLPLLVVAPKKDLKSLVYFLLGLMVFDFATGIAASHFVKKEAEKNDPKIKNQNLISSEKLKMSGVKFLLYGSTILIAFYLQKMLLIKDFEFDFSATTFTLTSFVILWWMFVEIFSIVFENFPKMGIDVSKIFSKILNKYKKTKKEFTS